MGKRGLSTSRNGSAQDQRRVLIRITVVAVQRDRNRYFGS